MVIVILPLNTEIKCMTKTKTYSALIIEDESDIANLIQLHLKEVCSDIHWANDGQKGLDQALSKEWDIIILDLRLPTLGGLDICKHIRASNQYTPIIMLTAKTTELDRVLGLEVGADDYLTKPFSVLELIARVKAIFRRQHALSQPTPEQTTKDNVIQQGELFLDLDKRIAKRNETTIELTAKEFDLLFYFAANPQRVFNRTQLLDQVWGYGHDGYEHTVNSHINRLRSKLEPDPSQPTYIQTVWGVGYKFHGQIS